ncbi:MAG: hypothetical protein K2Y37_18075 [Pirellulales bacterium]|nr:hypothetical protein [Pirellulales bacterium]
MEARRWHEQLEGELRRQGLPRAYRRRLAAELTEHFHDALDDRHCDRLFSTTNSLQQGDQGMEAERIQAVCGQLGDPVALAAGAAHEYQRRTFSGRHPILMFLVAPLPMALVAWAAVVVAVTSLFAWLGPESGAAVPAAWRYGMPVVLVLWAIVPPTLIALWVCRMSARSGRTWRWIAVSLALISLATAAFHSDMRWPTRPGNGQLLIGFGLNSHPSAAQCLRFSFPLLVAGWALLHFKRRLDGHDGGDGLGADDFSSDGDHARHALLDGRRIPRAA